MVAETVWGTAVAAAAGTLVALAIVTWTLGVPGTGPSPAGSKSFVLNSANESTGLSFPDCANVSATWTLTSGGPASFGVWPPAAVTHSDCPNHGASNSTPPPGYQSFQPGPVCYESGSQGSCWFIAGQHGYDFCLFGLWNGTVFTPVRGSVASIIIHWT